MGLNRWLTQWWGRRLRHKLLASSITIVLFFLILLGYLSFQVGQTGMRSEVDTRNLQLASLVAQDINAQFNNIWGNIRLLIYQLETSQTALSLQARAMLELRRASPLTYRALYLVDSEGTVLLHLADPLEELLAVKDVQEIVARSPIPLTEELSKAYAAAKNGGLFISPTTIAGADQLPKLTMGIPIPSSQEKQPPQVVLAEIDLRDVWRNVDEIRIGQTGRAFVVSKDGVIIAHPNRAYIGQPLAPALRQVIAGYEGQTEYTDPVSGQVMLAAYSPVGGQSGWGIVVEQERVEALAPINVIAFVTLGVVLVAVTLATAITIFLAQSITRPIQHLAETTQTIAKTGDLSHDVTVEGQDEVSQLATTFNQMIASLRDARLRLLAAQAAAQELHIARQIQASLLPQPSPLVAGLDVMAKSIPAHEVGGDFYDYYHLLSDFEDFAKGFAIAVGDVSGKGTPAALYMAVSSSALAAKARVTPDVGQLCDELNVMLYPRVALTHMNIALLYVYFSKQDYLPAEFNWTARIVNAGLIAPLLRRNGYCDYLDVGGLPLGVQPHTQYHHLEVPLQKGDWLVLCSDGIVEAMNAARVRSARCARRGITIDRRVGEHERELELRDRSTESSNVIGPPRFTCGNDRANR